MKNQPKKSTEYTWDTIANSFDTTRKKPWKQCLDFIDTFSKEWNIADLGCGNGRHLLPCAEHCRQVVGLDKSRNLLQITQQKIRKEQLKNVGTIQGDLIALPLRDNFFDAVLYIASLHNIKGKEHRIQSLKEVKRILKPGGNALISVWSRWQDTYRKYFLKQWFRIKDEKEFGDIEIYWKQQGLNVPRFYHLYSKKEIVSEIKQVGFCVEHVDCVKICSKKYPDNFFIRVRNETP